MRRSIYISILSILCMGYSLDIYAAHIVGGDVSYSFLSFSNNNTQVNYRVRFNMYLDNFSPGADFEEQAEFGVYQRQADGSWAFFDSRIADPQNAGIIIQDDNPCLDELDDVGVQSAFYEFDVTLDIVDQDYMIAYQLCCRNRSSSNIDNNVVGSVFNIIISPEAQRTGNSSPTFDRFPPIFICNDFELNVSLAVSDIDGDEVVYSFCAPLESGGGFATGPDPCELFEPPAAGCLPPFSRVTFLDPYSAENPLLGMPLVQIDPSTGIISGVPRATGQFVVGVCIEEFRNGVLLTSITRDFQFNVVPCVERILVELESDEVVVDDTNIINLITICGDSAVSFITSIEGSAVNNYEWNIVGPDGNPFFMQSGSALNELDLLLPETGVYNGFVVVDDGTECRDTAFFNVTKSGETQANFIIENLDTCFASEIDFIDRSITRNVEITDWQWMINNNVVSNNQNFSIEFGDTGPQEISLIVTDDAGCMDTLIESINYNPLHEGSVSFAIDTVLCANDSILFNGVWLTESGNFGEVIPFVETGCDSAGFTINLSILPPPEVITMDASICEGEVVDFFNQDLNSTGVFTNNIISQQSGCDSIITILDLEVIEVPRFVSELSEIFLPANQDNSLPITISGEFENILWTPATGLSCSDCPNPIINFNQDLTYTVVATNVLGCADSLSIDVNFVNVPDRYFIPNILGGTEFSNENNILYLQTIDEAVNDVTYNLKVYDRWGNLQFDGENLLINDMNSGWNISSIDSGVYVYLFEIIDFFDTTIEAGNVTVIK